MRVSESEERETETRRDARERQRRSRAERTCHGRAESVGSGGHPRANVAMARAVGKGTSYRWLAWAQLLGDETPTVHAHRQFHGPVPCPRQPRAVAAAAAAHAAAAAPAAPLPPRARRRRHRMLPGRPVPAPPTCAVVRWRGSAWRWGLCARGGTELGTCRPAARSTKRSRRRLAARSQVRLLDPSRHHVPKSAPARR